MTQDYAQVAKEAQRKYAATNDSSDKEAMIEAQRAFDRERHATESKRRLAAQRLKWEGAHARLQALAAEPVSLRSNLPPLGTCTRKRAEYLMMAASVSGGAVYVAQDIPWDGYLCVGTLPDGESVPTCLLSATAVLSYLRTEMIRLSRPELHGACQELADTAAATYRHLVGALS